MSQRVLNPALFVFLIVIALIVISVQFTDAIENRQRSGKGEDGGHRNEVDSNVPKKRKALSSGRERRAPQNTKRTTRKPGFIRTLFAVIYEQWNDTKHTFARVNNLVNDNFLPENAPGPKVSTPSAAPNTSTTEAPYKITRSEFTRIVQRNLRGLARLYNLEMRDAIRESNKNWAEYRKNASLEVSKWL